MRTYTLRPFNLDGCGDRRHRLFAMPPAFHVQDTPPLSTPDYWGAITDVACPACETGTIRWHEAGYVPAYRRCDTCRRHFMGKGTAAAPTLVFTGRTR